MKIKGYVDELMDRARLGTKWLVAQIEEDGSIKGADGDIGCYYKVVYPLRAAGYPNLAGKVLDRIMDLHYQDNGDLRNSEEQKSSGSYTSNFCQIYPNGWIILGAHLLIQFDVVRKLMKGVTDLYYDEAIGALRCCATPRVDLFDVNSASMGVELYTLWDINKAKRIADFLIRHAKNQPDPNNWYYSIVDKSFNYQTELDPKNPGYSALKVGDEKQSFWFLGLASAALTQLYQVTGDSKYLEGANLFYDYFLKCGDAGLHGVGSGKSFWAGAMLYRLTGDKKYLDVTQRIGKFLMSLQQEDGSFLPPWIQASEAQPKLLFDLNPEYVRWFLEVAAELNSADR